VTILSYSVVTIQAESGNHTGSAMYTLVSTTAQICNLLTILLKGGACLDKLTMMYSTARIIKLILCICVDS